MVAKSYVDIAREKVRQGKVKLTHHAQVERMNEQIGTEDIMNALLTSRELERYPH